MSWAGSEVWDLYLGLEAFGLAPQGTAPAWTSHTDVLAACSAAVAQVPRSRRLHRWLRRPEVRIWLSGAIARPFVIEWPDGLKGSEERLRLAKSMVAVATGLETPCAVWLSERAGSTPSLAVALDAQLPDTLSQAAARQGLVASSIRPWWSKVLQLEVQQSSQLDLLVVEDEDSLTVLGSQSNRWILADSYVPASLGQHCEALIARRTLSMGLASDRVRRLRKPRREGDRSSSWLQPQPLASFAES